MLLRLGEQGWVVKKAWLEDYGEVARGHEIGVGPLSKYREQVKKVEQQMTVRLGTPLDEGVKALESLTRVADVGGGRSGRVWSGVRLGGRGRSGAAGEARRDMVMREIRARGRHRMATAGGGGGGPALGGAQGG